MITLAQLKAQLVIDTDYTEEDTYLNRLISAAEAYVASHTGRTLDYATVIDYHDDFPTTDYIELKQAPFISLTSITYVDTNGTRQTWTASPEPWVVVTDEGMPRIYLGYDQDWPDARCQKKSVQITYLAGYASGSPLTTNAPEDLKHAALMIAATMYDQREDHVVGVAIQSVPLAAKHLMAPYRLHRP